MTISTGDTLPAATLLTMGANGAEQVDLGAKLKGRKVVLFGLPGAFTGTCSEAHLPSFMRTKPGFDAKGVDEVICLSGNDPFVMKAWGETTGATAAGITLLGDPSGDFIMAIGMEMNNPALGLRNRSRRFSALVEDGVVTHLNLEVSPGTCEISAGETLLAAI